MCKNILTIDIGNSNVVFGLFVDGQLAFTARSLTDRKKTSDDFAVTLHGIFTLNNRNIRDVDGSVISSVVPHVTTAIISGVKKLTGIVPLIVNPETARIKIDVDSLDRLGTDRIANAVAAAQKYGKPVVILDLGTATTVSVVGDEGSFIGGCIYPGVMTSLEALSGAAAQLPHIDLSSDPGSVIAKNTFDCMHTGIVYGTAAMLDGIIGRIEDELGTNVLAVATGGLAQNIIRHCKKNILFDANLMLEGLYNIYMLNSTDNNKDGDF